MKINKLSLIAGVVLLTLCITTSALPAQDKQEGKKVKIGLIGDSTVAPQSGWGPAFAKRFNMDTEILNYAVNGATLQSLAKRLDALLELKPDYVLIQFGHNDQKRYGTEAYSHKLRSYVDRIEKAGAKPVIISSVVRRSFDTDGKIISNLVKNDRFTFKGTLAEYARAARKTAAEMNVPFVDLYTISEQHHNTIGPEASMTYNFKEGDRTHFNRKGAEAIADLIVPALVAVVPELTPCLSEQSESDKKK